MTSTAPAQAPSVSAAGVDWAERLALGGSCLCLIHCLALPLIVAALPAASSGLAIPESFHRWVLALAIPTASLALVQGQRRHHRAWPLAMGAVGLALLAAGTFLLAEGTAETVATVCGSLVLASAHIGNWRMRHAAGECCEDDACPAARR